MTVKVLAVLALLAVAQIIPSCGSGQPVIGTVDAKWVSRDDEKIIVIDHVEYTVPYTFWNQVDVGDLVKRTDKGWTIIRKARP
ncbi:MAG: hypothetical protein FJX73_02555 [Armatimonadetes bacterium]|nr:hypothetical protein [Armatimonadota bacterium]